MAKPDCQKCGAKCCRYFALEIDEPDTVKDFDDVRWYVAHGKTSVFVEDEKWYVQVFAKCQYLDKENRCRIYDRRPRICRKYDLEECEFDGWDPDVLLETPEEVEAYVEEHLGKDVAKSRKKRGKKRKKDKRKKEGK